MIMMMTMMIMMMTMLTMMILMMTMLTMMIKMMTMQTQQWATVKSLAWLDHHRLHVDNGHPGHSIGSDQGPPHYGLTGHAIKMSKCLKNSGNVLKTQAMCSKLR